MHSTRSTASMRTRSKENNKKTTGTPPATSSRSRSKEIVPQQKRNSRATTRRNSTKSTPSSPQQSPVRDEGSPKISRSLRPSEKTIISKTITPTSKTSNPTPQSRAKRTASKPKLSSKERSPSPQSRAKRTASKPKISSKERSPSPQSRAKRTASKPKISSKERSPSPQSRAKKRTASKPKISSKERSPSPQSRAKRTASKPKISSKESSPPPPQGRAKRTGSKPNAPSQKRSPSPQPRSKQTTSKPNIPSKERSPSSPLGRAKRTGSKPNAPSQIRDPSPLRSRTKRTGSKPNVSSQNRSPSPPAPVNRNVLKPDIPSQNKSSLSQPRDSRTTSNRTRSQNESPPTKALSSRIVSKTNLPSQNKSPRPQARSIRIASKNKINLTSSRSPSPPKQNVPVPRPSTNQLLARRAKSKPELPTKPSSSRPKPPPTIRLPGKPSGRQKRKLARSSSSSESEEETESVSNSNVNSEQHPQPSTSRQAQQAIATAIAPSRKERKKTTVPPLPQQPTVIPQEPRPAREEPQQQQRHPTAPEHRFLPAKHLLPVPMPTSSNEAITGKLQILKNKVRSIVSVIFNNVQDNELSIDEAYQIIERIYDYYSFVFGGDSTYNEADVTIVAKKYRNMVVYVLWHFGPIIWKILHNPGIQNVKDLLCTCILRLGWVKSTRRNKIRPFREWKQKDCPPAAYYTVNMCVKYNSEPNMYIRHSQLQILQKLVELADSNNNRHYLEHVYNTGHKMLMIRLKDKYTSCRISAMSILSKLVKVDGAEDVLMKELKYYTRFDPSTEVRRIGTIALKEVERLRLRFFFDQAFDRNISVRFEAFKAMGMERKPDFEQDVDEIPPENNNDEEAEAQPAQNSTQLGLLRDMNQLSNERLCKLVLWGTTFTDSAKCSNYVKSDLLSKWLKVSCNNDLIKFLTNFDAYSNMKSVIKILDMMIRSSETFVDELDLKFIQELKANISLKRFKAVSIEGMIAWQCICKASKNYEALRRYVPDPSEMLGLIECLHDCVIMEHNLAVTEQRTEDAGPIVAIVVGLGICRFVTWEEGSRKELLKIIKDILLDPLLDERMLVIEGMTVLHLFCEKDNHEFEDVMLEVFQDIFDADNQYNRERGQNADGNTAGATTEAQGPRRHTIGDPSAASRRSSTASFEPVNPHIQINQGPPPPPSVQAPSLYALTKLKDELCNLISERFELHAKKDKLLNEKKFTDAIPVSQEIINIQAKESALKNQVKEMEEEIQRAKTNRGRDDDRNEAIAPEPAAPQAITNRHSMINPVTSTEDEIMAMDVEEEEEELHQPRVITSVEEGLSKGLFMINGYMELCPHMNSFLRNLYENYVSVFMTEQDTSIRVSVIQFLTRIAMAEKRELTKVVYVLVKILLADNAEIETLSMAFKCVVDLLSLYEWKDFMLKETDDTEDEQTQQYKKDFTIFFRSILENHNDITYETITLPQIRNFFISLLTTRYLPQSRQNYSDHINVIRNQGLLKLFVRGRIQDPFIVSKILLLWANKDYCATPVLRDLESVLRCYGEFGWWNAEDREQAEYVSFIEEEENVGTAATQQPEIEQGQEADAAEEPIFKEGNRVLGIGFAIAVTALCEGPDRQDEMVLKFVSYMLTFLNVKDHPLMRAIAVRILCKVESNSSSSYNPILIKAASKIPIYNHVSAKYILRKVNSIIEVLRPHPVTASVTATSKELKSLIKKYIRIFGEEVAVIEEEVPSGLNRSRIVGDDIEFFDDEDQREENVFERNSIIGSNDEDEQQEENRDSASESDIYDA